MSIASLSANFSTSLSISRVNAVTPVRPRIAQERTGQSSQEVSQLERSQPERSKPERSKPARSEPEQSSLERAQPERSVTRQAPLPAQAPTTAERTRFRSRQSEEGSLTLTTDEGDKVTISFSNQQNTRVDQTRLYGPNGSFESTKTRSRESSQLSVSLDGNLSEAELKDITDLVNRLSAGIQSDRPSQAASANTPEDLGTLQSYSFAYQQSSQVNYKSTLISVTA